MSNINRSSLFIACLAHNMKKAGNENKNAFVDGTITNDLRIFEIPKITLQALKVTEKACERTLRKPL